MNLPRTILRNVWQNQKPEGIRMSVEEIRRRAGKFQKKIYWRNLREYVAGLVVVVFFGFYFWRTSDALTRGALGLLIAGVLYVMWYLHRQGSSRSLPADLGLASGIDFYRRELKRQRDLLASVWAWYLGPLIPGFVALRVALASPHLGTPACTWTQTLAHERDAAVRVGICSRMAAEPYRCAQTSAPNRRTGCPPGAALTQWVCAGGLTPKALVARIFRSAVLPICVPPHRMAVAPDPP